MTVSKTNSIFKHSLLSAAILTSMAAAPAFAAPQTFTFNVSTIQDVSVTERQALAFGTAIKLDATAQCGHAALNPSTHDWDTGASFALPPTGTDAVALAGAGCADTSTANSAYGVYLVTGAAGTDVKVTLGDGTSFTGEGESITPDSKFTFVPAGVVDVALGTGTASPGTALTSGSAQTVTLDTNGNAGILVGGTLTIGTDSLAAGEDLKGNFTIDVTY